MATTQVHALINQLSKNESTHVDDITQIYPLTYAKDSTVEDNSNEYLLEKDVETVQDLAEAVADDIMAIYDLLGSGAETTVELTQEEYDVLPASKLTNNTTYYIKDSSGSEVPAANIYYDDTTTQLGANTIQGAIEALTPVIHTATLAAGNTTVTFTNIPTTGNNLIELYTSVAGLEYIDVDDSTAGQLTYTFDAQESAVDVYLTIREVG